MSSEIIKKHLERISSQRGFTLVELLVVILIIAILIVLATLVFGGQQEKASDGAAKANLRNAYVALKVDSVSNRSAARVTNIAADTIEQQTRLTAEPRDDAASFTSNNNFGTPVKRIGVFVSEGDVYLKIAGIVSKNGVIGEYEFAPAEPPPPPGSLDLSLDPGTGVNSSISEVQEQSDGKILIGGSLTSYNGTEVGRIARINADGSLDTSFNPGSGFNEAITTLALQSDGKILVGGTFSQFNGVSRNRIARLNADGSLDTSFDPGSGFNSSLTDVIIQSDGKILVGGVFASFNNVSRIRVARLNSDGTLDTSFDPGTGANNNVTDMDLQSDGKLVIIGRFTSYNGTAINRIARINSDGSLDTSFSPGVGPNTSVSTVSVKSDNKVVVGGVFTTFSGLSRRYIAQLNADGSLDTSFNPGTGTTSSVQTVLAQGNGKILLGGNFTAYNGTTLGNFARINADGTLDSGFNTTPGANGQVLQIARKSNGRILIVGSFQTYDGVSRRGIAQIYP
jgi:uncharacterized delta-60 repeat protein/prepilin-type N-terminal cleavage/methylation domain-containing protein